MKVQYEKISYPTNYSDISFLKLRWTLDKVLYLGEEGEGSLSGGGGQGSLSGGGE